MNAKILLIALSAAAFSSCSTAYKSGQTPDDVYYSPVRVVDESRNDNKRDEVRRTETTADDARIRMQIRDYRWRDLNNEYDYSYNNSPYNYCTCTCNSYGYYYNPYYYSRPVYSTKYIAAAPINSTPRTVNLNTYKNYSTAVTTNQKTGAVTTWSKPTRQYNNNNGGSRVGNIIREVLSPSSTPTNNNNTNSSSNNNTRTYSPSNNSTPSSTPSSSGSSSGGSSSGGSVSRPGRGG
jgi:hypothetical protein